MFALFDVFYISPLTFSQAQQATDATSEEQPPKEEATKTTEEEEEIDIDLEDPEVAKAAEKIQAGFKGFKARKEVKALRVGHRSKVIGVLVPASYSLGVLLTSFVKCTNHILTYTFFPQHKHSFISISMF